jgi:hypothetical protein
MLNLKKNNRVIVTKLQDGSARVRPTDGAIGYMGEIVGSMEEARGYLTTNGFAIVNSVDDWETWMRKSIGGRSIRTAEVVR